MLEPRSTDSLGHQHCTKKLSPKIALHLKVLCESKAMIPLSLIAEPPNFKKSGQWTVLWRSSKQFPVFVRLLIVWSFSTKTDIQ